ncbi:MAG: asparagine synthase (glutamine-hydrolyzing) [Acidobacteriia bacterium]|nr:asparagine synthase (glutamine-hydrolyzing) [Terriglobia bacterium]
MCGIAGICNSQSAYVDTDVLKGMIGLVRHRGPDEWGLHADHGIGLANARLSIIDVDGGHQPIHNEDESLWITFNGEIFNYVELRKQLLAHGHIFATHSDTEVILHLYEEKGEECVRYLNGQWGMAVWDARERKLFLSRDRLGVRPLFYTKVGGNLIFGSEIKSLFAHPGVCREIDRAGLDQIFTFWFTVPPRTIFKDICELPPASSLTFKDGEIRIHCYWQLDFDSPEIVRPEGEYVEQLSELLTDATRIRLRSDVPVGAYLSGGLDSTIVTALANQIVGSRLRTFSIGFTPEELDETPFQQDAIRFLNTAHQQIRCGYNDVAAAFPEMIWHTEQPIIRAAPAPLYLLSRLVRDNGYKVVLTGEGADEIFGGYDIYKEQKIRRFWAAQPQSAYRPRLLRRLYPYQNNLQKQPDAYLQKFFHASQEDLRNPFFSHLPRWELTSRLKVLFSDEMHQVVPENNAVSELAGKLPLDYFRWNSFCQAQYLETMFLLPGYILSSQGDRVALAHSVETRHPFLDYRVVEFAAKLPQHLKMKVLNEKYILKRAFGQLLPPAILNRHKQPYRAPDGRSFFAGGADVYLEELLAPGTIEDGGLFDAPAVAKLVEKFKTGRAIGVKDDMALVGVLSTQLVIHQFVTSFQQGGPSWTDYRQNYAVS